jgi:hypothetical protein
MSQVEVNNSINSVNVVNAINTVDVNQEVGNILIVPQETTMIVEVVTPGPQGPPGDVNLLTGSFVLTSSFNAFTASYNTGSFTGSFVGNGSGLRGVISSSFSVTSSFAQNFNPDATASYALQALTASYAISASQAITASYALNVPTTASFAISASQATNANNAISASQAINSKTSSFQSNIQFAQSYIPFFNSNNSMSSSAMRQWTTESITINEEFGTANNPEALYIFQPNPDSINIITAEADIDNYIQLNVFNRNSGSTASTDIVATADNGNEFVNFIDMGINSSTFTGSVGGPNDAYLYSTGNDLTIGNATANKHIRFFTGGGLVDVYQKLVLNPDNLHEMTGSLNIKGALIVTDGITGSLQGTASSAITASYASFANTASFALNFNPSATASYAVSASNAISASRAISASYAATSSYASNFTVAGTLTAQTINVQTITSSVDYVTGSTIFGSQLTNTHQFTGSVTVTGSLAVNNSNVILTNQTSSMSVSTASFALTASFLSGSVNINTGSFATTGSNTFYGLQTISASNTSPAALDIHVINEGLWTFRTYNDTYSPTLIGLASWIDNTGVSFLGTETDKPLHLYNNGQYAQPTLLLSSSGVTIQPGLTITGSLKVSNGITGSLFGTASFAAFATTASFALGLSPTTTASFAISASQAITASFAFTASFIDGGSY